MGSIAQSNFIAGGNGMLRNAGAPTAGVNEVETLTFGGTITGGTFVITQSGHTTAPITWSGTNATLVANIKAALEALPFVGSGNTTVAVGTMTAGIGTITVTYSGANVAALAVATMTLTSSLTGTSPTVAVAKTTTGVTATGRNASIGQLLTDTTNGELYINQSAPPSPTFVKVSGE